MAIGQTPVSAANATSVIVPTSFDIANSTQLALLNQGDGFYAFKGSLTVDSTIRAIKTLNGEVIPGTGMKLKVRDYVALIDGVIIGNQSKSKFNPAEFEEVTLGAISGTRYLTVKATKILNSDGQNVDDFQKGILEISTTKPAADSGKLVVCKLSIPSNTTQITASMIDNTVKKYLKNIDDLSTSTSNPGNPDLVQTGLYLDLELNGNRLDSSTNSWSAANFQGMETYITGANDVGQAAHFDGASDFTVAMDPFITSTGATLEFWARHTSNIILNQPTYSVMLSATNYATFEFIWDLDATTGQSPIPCVLVSMITGPTYTRQKINYFPESGGGHPGAIIFPNDGAQGYSGQGFLGHEDLTLWHHYCTTYNSSTGDFKFFIDKVCRGIMSVPNPGQILFGNTIPTMMIGASYNGGVPTNADLDNLRIYTRPLTDGNVTTFGQTAGGTSEIAQNYAADGGI